MITILVYVLKAKLTLVMLVNTEANCKLLAVNLNYALGPEVPGYFICKANKQYMERK